MIFDIYIKSIVHMKKRINKKSKFFILFYGKKKKIINE